MTKRRVLVKQLLAAGFVYEKGSNHDKYVKGSVTVTVGRHREISDEMAKVILRQAGLRWRMHTRKGCCYVGSKRI